MNFIFDFNLMQDGWAKDRHKNFFSKRGVDVSKVVWTADKKFLGREEGAFTSLDGQYEIWTKFEYFRHYRPEPVNLEDYM